MERVRPNDVRLFLDDPLIAEPFFGLEFGLQID